MGNCSQPLSERSEGKGRGEEGKGGQGKEEEAGGKGKNRPQILVTAVYSHWFYAQRSKVSPSKMNFHEGKKSKKESGKDMWTSGEPDLRIALFNTTHLEACVAPTAWRRLPFS